MYVIARACNGVPLNGREYILDESNELMLFINVKQAVKFMNEHNVKRDSYVVLQGDK